MKKFKSSRLFKSVIAAALALAMTFSTSISAEAAVAGIDVSKYQGAINWAGVAQSGMSFAFIKVGSTNSGIDPYFAANVRGAQAAGVRTGVYIYSYATSVEAAAQEAALVLQWIDGYNINYPIAFDIEDKCQKGLDANTVTAMCNTFCSIISAAGYTPIVYTYANFYKTHITSALAYEKWIAQYNDHCDIPGFAIWQYSSAGTVGGIAGRVDMNVASKDYAAVIPQVGFVQADATNLFLFNNYRRQFGWVDIAGNLYHTDEATGIVTTGWYADATGTYYFGEGAAASTGLVAIDKGVYYFDENHHLYLGWLDLNGLRYLFNPNENGKMYTGWWLDSAGAHYLDTTDGHMVTGVATIDKSVYYFDANGIMQIGLQTINGNTYFFGTDGKMQTGWQTIGAGRYYFGTDGALYKGLLQQKDGVYGLDEKDGHQLVNTVASLSGLNFAFGADGKLVVNQVVQIGNMLYQTDATGVVVAQAPAPAAATAAQK